MYGQALKLQSLQRTSVKISKQDFSQTSQLVWVRTCVFHELIYSEFNLQSWERKAKLFGNKRQETGNWISTRECLQLKRTKLLSSTAGKKQEKKYLLENNFSSNLLIFLSSAFLSHEEELSNDFYPLQRKLCRKEQKKYKRPTIPYVIIESPIYPTLALSLNLMKLAFSLYLLTY